MAIHGGGYPHSNRPHEILLNPQTLRDIMAGGVQNTHMGLQNLFLGGVAPPMKQDCFPIEFMGGGTPHEK